MIFPFGFDLHLQETIERKKPTKREKKQKKKYPERKWKNMLWVKIGLTKMAPEIAERTRVTA